MRVWWSLTYVDSHRLPMIPALMMPEDTILKEMSHEKVQLPLVLKKINKNPNLEIAKTCHVKIATAYSPQPVACSPSGPSGRRGASSGSRRGTASSPTEFALGRMALCLAC